MRALSASSRAAPASVKSLPTTKTLSQRAASARNRSTISDIALSSSTRTSAYGTPRHASYGSGCGKRGRRRSMDGSEPSTAETTGRNTPSRSTRWASRSNSPSETAALPVPGSQLVTYSPSDIRCSHRLVQERRTALTAMAPVRGSGHGTILPRPPLRGDLRGPWCSARTGTRAAHRVLAASFPPHASGPLRVGLREFLLVHRPNGRWPGEEIAMSSPAACSAHSPGRRSHPARGTRSARPEGSLPMPGHVRWPGRGGAMSTLSLPSPETPDSAGAQPETGLASRAVPPSQIDPDDYSFAFAALALGLTLGVLVAVVVAACVLGGT